MLKKTLALAALAGAALLGTTPALADGYRHGYGHGHNRVVVVHKPVPHYAQHRGYGYRPYAYRQAYAERPVVVRHAPAVVYRRHSSSHDVLGGLLVGAVLGAVIASHAGY